MKSRIAKFQIGKQGITQGVIESLALALKNHKQVRVSVLKSSGRDKTIIREMALELQNKIPIKFNYRTIGFTIIIQKVKK